MENSVVQQAFPGRRKIDDPTCHPCNHCQDQLNGDPFLHPLATYGERAFDEVFATNPIASDSCCMQIHASWFESGHAKTRIESPIARVKS
jgi:hypothetical protein